MRLFCAHAVLAMLLAVTSACSTALPPRPPGSGPFFRSLPHFTKETGFISPWTFGAGLALGVGLALIWRRLRSSKALKTKDILWAKWSSGDASRLEAALDLLNEIALAWRRRKKVVRLGEWLGKKYRPNKSASGKF